MTWKEFKEEVDRQLKEADIPDRIDIWYIDTSFPTRVEIEVEDIGMKIT